MTEEQKEELERASQMPIVYDADSPRLTLEQLRRFHRVNPPDGTKRK